MHSPVLVGAVGQVVVCVAPVGGGDLDEPARPPRRHRPKQRVRHLPQPRRVLRVLKVVDEGECGEGGVLK